MRLVIAPDEPRDEKRHREPHDAGVLHRADHADRVLREGGLRGNEGAQAPLLQVAVAAHVVDHLLVDRTIVEGVDREVPALRVLLHGPEEDARIR